jgi:hypothetical protein
MKNKKDLIFLFPEIASKEWLSSRLSVSSGRIRYRQLTAFDPSIHPQSLLAEYMASWLNLPISECLDRMRRREDKDPK